MTCKAVTMTTFPCRRINTLEPIDSIVFEAEFPRRIGIVAARTVFSKKLEPFEGLPDGIDLDGSRTSGLWFVSYKKLHRHQGKTSRPLRTGPMVWSGRLTRYYASRPIIADITSFML